MLRTLFLLPVALFLFACGKEASDPTPVAAEPNEIVAKEPVPWVVTAAHPLATQAGARVLSEGGSAADAAVAVQAVLGLVEPQSSGLGGGAFMMYYDASTDRLTSYDGREIAPMTAHGEMFLKENGTPMPFYDAVTSGLSVGVPGAVAMLEMAHKDHGKLDWSELFTEAENLATNGFPVTERLSGLLSRFYRFSENEEARALFYDANGNAVTGGTTLTNPAYADTVKQIAERGARAFYTGEIAQAIVTAVNDKAGEGTMSLEDLAGYEPLVREPVCAPFLQYKVCSMAPPSSGGVTVLQILGLYERSAANPSEMNDDSWAAYVEATRLAYADRNHYLADPTAMGEGNVTAEELVEALVSKDYLDSRAELIGQTAAPEVVPGNPLPEKLNLPGENVSPELPGTSHFSIRDSDGNIVSMTTTVEFAFGSHLMAAGFVLNNQLTDFSFVPRQKDGQLVVNAPAAGKRPRSSMAPVIVLDTEGQPVMAIGSPGGPAIIGYVAQTLIASLAWDLPLQQAIELPHVTVPRGSVLVEKGTSPELTEMLVSIGHEVTERDLTSGLYGFAMTADGIESGVDPRRDGTLLTNAAP